MSRGLLAETTPERAGSGSAADGLAGAEQVLGPLDGVEQPPGAGLVAARAPVAQGEREVGGALEPDAVAVRLGLELGDGRVLVRERDWRS